MTAALAKALGVDDGEVQKAMQALMPSGSPPGDAGGQQGTPPAGAGGGAPPTDGGDDAGSGSDAESGVGSGTTSGSSSTTATQASTMTTPRVHHGPTATTTTSERDGRPASTAPDVAVRRRADPTAPSGSGPSHQIAPTALVVDVVVPVYNEQRALPDAIRRLHDFLSTELPFSWRITIADNASTDETPRLAQALARDLPGVTLLTLPEKGRGRALRAAWTQSDAAVRCYMDVDLSTDLRALLPLVAPLVSGHSDIAIGTRLARGSRVVRGPKRELISRAYNRLLHLSLAARFSDAQCGFKAIRADVAERLLPQVADQAWFFDTELLVLAQREGLRIHEVPVDWTDDPDSTVDIARTAIEDLKGIGRLLLASPPARFLMIGVVSTLAYVLLYLGLRPQIGAVGANVAALALTAVGNTQANRRFAFRVRGRDELASHHAKGLAVFVLTLGLTTGALAVLHAIDARPSAVLELAVLVAASVSATVTRFVALRSWVFGRRSSPPAADSAGEAAPSRSTTAATALADRSRAR